MVFLFTPELFIFKLLNFERLSFLSLEKKSFKSNNPIFRHNFGTNTQPNILVRVKRVTYLLWFWEWLWFGPGDSRNPVKMQPTPLRGQYKTRTGWKHFPNFFLSTELRCCLLQSQHSDTPKYPVCWFQQSSCSGMLLLFWENNTANCLD